MADKLSSETSFAMCVDLDNLVTQRRSWQCVKTKLAVSTAQRLSNAFLIVKCRNSEAWQQHPSIDMLFSASILRLVSMVERINRAKHTEVCKRNVLQNADLWAQLGNSMKWLHDKSLTAPPRLKKQQKECKIPQQTRQWHFTNASLWNSQGIYEEQKHLPE